MIKRHWRLLDVVLDQLNCFGRAVNLTKAALMGRLNENSSMGVQVSPSLAIGESNEIGLPALQDGDDSTYHQSFHWTI